MRRNPLIMPRPIVKWAGGKSSSVAKILAYMPEKISTYHEPCFGGGAVFFALVRAGRFRRAVIGDTNREVTTTMIAVRDELPAVIEALAELGSVRVTEERYNEIREFTQVGSVGVAARFIFLNKTGFNGLYRVNRDGEFNVPWGKHEHFVPDRANLHAVSSALQGVEISRSGYNVSTEDAGKGDVVYFDPPYFPISKTANFTAYTRRGFSLADQIRLASTFAELSAQKATVLASNADVPQARAIYGAIPGVETVELSCRRNVNSDGSKRGRVGELLFVANGKLRAAQAAE